MNMKKKSSEHIPDALQAEYVREKNDSVVSIFTANKKIMGLTSSFTSTMYLRFFRFISKEEFLGEPSKEQVRN